MVSAALDPLQCVQQLVRCDGGNRSVRDPTEQLQEPPCFLDGGRRLSLALHLLDELFGDKLERCLGGEFGFQASLALFLRWVDIVFKLSLALSRSLRACCNETSGEAPSESFRSTPNFR